jgi:hypothetical protein
MDCRYKVEVGEEGYVVAKAQRCLKEDALWETSTLLRDLSIKVLMQRHELNRETAKYWISNATECAE